MGGLGAAGLLAKRGYKVLVLEQHGRAGGSTHVFRKGGYEFDTGLHYIGARVGEHDSEIRKLFDVLTDAKLEWDKLDERFDTATISDEPEEQKRKDETTLAEIQAYEHTHWELHEDPAIAKQELLDGFPDPQDQKAIKNFFCMMKAMKVFAPLLFMTKVLPPCLSNAVTTLLTPLASGWFFKSTREWFSQYSQNEELLGILTYNYGDFGLPPAHSPFVMNALLTDHFHHGGYYPKGGPEEIARGICSMIQRRNGHVLVQAPVDRILLDETGTKAIGVEVQGHQIFAKKILSTAGFVNTFHYMLPDHGRQWLQGQELNELELPRELSPSIAMMSVFIGLEGSQEELQLPLQNEWIFSSWNHDRSFDLFMADQEAPFPAVFVSYPSAKDSLFNLRYPGKSVAVVIGPVNYAWFKGMDLGNRNKKRGEGYGDLKEYFQERMLNIFYHHHPHLREKVTFVDSGSPLTNNRYYGTHSGEVYGLAHTARRFLNKMLKPRTEIRNLYLGGQDVATCGITGALISGFLSSASIDKNILVDNLGVFNPSVES